jgi:uncharacterized protein (DUF3084 family)
VAAAAEALDVRDEQLQEREADIEVAMEDLEAREALVAQHKEELAAQAEELAAQEVCLCVCVSSRLSTC